MVGQNTLNLDFLHTTNVIPPPKKKSILKESFNLAISIWKKILALVKKFNQIWFIILHLSIKIKYEIILQYFLMSFSKSFYESFFCFEIIVGINKIIQKGFLRHCNIEWNLKFTNPCFWTPHLEQVSINKANFIIKFHQTWKLSAYFHLINKVCIYSK